MINRSLQTKQTGFVLNQILLMIALAAMLMLTMFTAISVNKRVQMVHTHDVWAQTVKVTRDTINTRVAEQSDLPNSNGQWIKTYKHALHKSLHNAPLGGPAFVANNNGSTITGAIGVATTGYGNTVILTRPNFAGLKDTSVTITKPTLLVSEVNTGSY